MIEPLWTNGIILPQSVVDLLGSSRDNEEQDDELELENSTDYDDDDEDWCKCCLFFFVYHLKVLMGWNRNSIRKDSTMFPVETMLNRFRVVHLII